MQRLEEAVGLLVCEDVPTLLPDRTLHQVHEESSASIASAKRTEYRPSVRRPAWAMSVRFAMLSVVALCLSCASYLARMVGIWRLSARVSCLSCSPGQWRRCGWRRIRIAERDTCRRDWPVLEVRGYADSARGNDIYFELMFLMVAVRL